MLALFVREGKIIRREVKDFSHNLSKKKLKFQIFELLLKLKKNYLFVKMEFIAEIGLNYNANKGLISEMVRLASISGADFAKLQLGWRDKKGEINHLTKNDLESFIDICSYYQIEPLFSIFHSEAWELIKSLNNEIKVVKIASRTLKQDKELIKEIQNSINRLIISTGMESIKEAKKNNFKGDYLWCISKYPALPKDLNSMPLDFKLDGYAGFSDHSQGITASLLAIARGAEIIERHFTLDKSDTTIRDHALSSTPEEFSQLVSLGRELNRLCSTLNA